ncbi:hypothetical protein cypCar_00049405 [Cyprinus carpio]|nr:hypothetical protein cypCar_00049405 [Cyprinus carpio]
MFFPPDVFFAGLTNTKEGDSVTLHTGVHEIQKHDVILWMFGPLSPDTFLAEINTTLGQISYSDDVRLRNRVRLDDQSGSLTISNSRSTDTGLYQLQITNSKETFYKRYNVFVDAPEPGLSSGGLALICVFVLMIVAAAGIAGVCYSRRKYSRLKGSVIAQIPERTSKTSFRDDERFRGRLQLDSETGDLTIRDVKITQSGDYQLKLIRARQTKSRKFKLILYGS